LKEFDDWCLKHPQAAHKPKIEIPPQTKFEKFYKYVREKKVYRDRSFDLHFLRKDLKHGFLISEDDIKRDLFKFNIMNFARRKSCCCTGSCFPKENKVIMRLEMRELLNNNEIRLFLMQNTNGVFQSDEEKEMKSEISSSFDYSDHSASGNPRYKELKTIAEE
jgi:hypothetical protein